MEIKVIASGSRGNSTAIETSAGIILFDAGISLKSIQKALNFRNPAALFITHEHSDHAKIATIQELMMRGVAVYMTYGTFWKLHLERRDLLHLILPEERVIRLEGVKVRAITAVHDAAEPVNFVISDGEDKAAYITDTGKIASKPAALTKLIIEANYDSNLLFSSSAGEAQKARIAKNHLSLEQAIKFVTVDQWKLKEVHLIHVSKRHGDMSLFRQIMSQSVREGIKVSIN